MNIVIPSDFPPRIQGSPHLNRLNPYGNISLYKDRISSLDEQIMRSSYADIIVNTRGIIEWKKDVLYHLPNLKLIATCSVGTDMIDLETATNLGITVCNVPNRTVPVVAEHGLGLMVAVAKQAAFRTAVIKSGGWHIKQQNTYLKGKTLGLIGAGNLGSEMARLGKAIGMNVIAWTFNPSSKRASEIGIEFVGFDELLKTSDVISVHVKLTDQSRGMIGKREFDMMKDGVLFINIARGAIIDTVALIQALNTGKVSGAGLDVYTEEPISADDPLLNCENVVLTSHCADNTPEGDDLLVQGAVDNVVSFLEGTPQNVVN